MNSCIRFNEGQLQRLSELYPSVEPQVLLEDVQALGFGVQGYLGDNPDLTAAGLSAPDAVFHYLSHGAVTEQRRFTLAESPSKQAWTETLRKFSLQTPAARRLLANLLWNRYLAGGFALNGADAWAGLLDACQGRQIALVLVIGDSHSEAYVSPRVAGGKVIVPIHLLCSGGSAAGLSNPKSKSGYGSKIRATLDAWATLIRDFRLPLFFKFGQVDAEFVWVFKRTRGGGYWSVAGFEAFAEDAVGHYLGYLERSVGVHGLARHLRVLSIFPPALSDAAWHAGYVNAHIGYLESETALAELSEQVKRLAIPSQWQRTRLHALWNAMVMRECARRGFLYVDDFQPLLGPDGVVDAAFMAGHDGANHHLRFDLLDGVVESVLTRYAHVV